MTVEPRESGEVRRAQSLARALDGLTDQAVLTLDPTGRVTTWNLGAEHLFGTPSSQAVGRHLWSVTAGHRCHVLRPRDLELAERDGSTASQRTLVEDDGRRRHLHVLVVALISDVAVTGYAALIAEITPDFGEPVGDADRAARTEGERSRTQAMRERLEELQVAVAARDEFIATVAHELRNPIAPLTFQLRMAIEKSEQLSVAGESVPVEWIHSQLRRFEQRLHRLLETLDRLLDVSRLSSGRIDLQLEPVDLAAVVREVIATLEAELAIARCPVTVLDRVDAVGFWDRLRIEQICRNLLSNAIRFGAGRPIEVWIDADADVVTLEVRDNGIGIARDQQSRIFERFERGIGQRSGGFGIGLWVVKNICLAMGGTIVVASQLGEGARFVVKLPRHIKRESTTSERSDSEDGHDIAG